MQIVKGDLLQDNNDWDCLIHCCNLFHTMGGGIAYYVKKKYPEAFQADLETENGDESKLGTFSKAKVNNNTKIIYNLYAQNGIGNDGHPLNRNLSYDHLYNGLWKIMEDIMKEYPFGCAVGIPAWIGCGLAGGDVNIVEAILHEINNNFGYIHINVYKLEK
jgi:O-acetyl-ADP-ribose deacetylase (regulator of RNase III)